MSGDFTSTLHFSRTGILRTHSMDHFNTYVANSCKPYDGARDDACGIRGCVVKGGTQSLEKVVEEGVEDIWMHFEGRNVPEMSKMVQTLIEIRRKAGRLPVDGWGNRKRKGSFSTPIGEDFPSSSTNLHPPPIEAISLSPGLERKLSSSSSSSALHSGAAASSLAPLLPSTAAFTPSALDIALKLPKLTISIEFEKTNRPGLEELMPLADVLFFSKVYAEGKGFPGAPTGFFDNVRRGCKPGAILFLTWGEHGAFGLVNDPTRPARTFHCPAPPIVAAVDTIGAGDTFAAGIIYAMGTLGCDAMEAANWACRLATAKCKQVGFEGVAERVPLPTE
ncbi:Ribokinase-like protein [Chytridium lagenaria]|nr:Ribokinase-like protein [Chytridium lagenaria]